jgi:hypothetical protein
MIELRIPLFSLASFELPIAGEEIHDPLVFKQKGHDLEKRLNRVSKIVKTLLSNNWTIIGELSTLVAYHDDVHSVVDAVTVLQQLHINLGGLTIIEADDEFLFDDQC